MQRRYRAEVETYREEIQAVLGLPKGPRADSGPWNETQRARA